MTMPRQRRFRRLAPAIALVLSLVPAPSTAGSAVTPRIDIEPSGWGSTDLAQLRSLLQEVHSVYAAAHMGRRVDRLHVSPTIQGPIVHPEEGREAEFRVQLSARDGRWYQFAYQYGHELCHVYADFSMKRMSTDAVGDDLQWFEESLCEAASLFTLRRLAARWADPQHPWHASAERFARYERLLHEAPHRRLPENENLAQWYRAHAQKLSADPYLRQKNEVVANQLLALLEDTPGGLEAMAYLSQCGSKSIRDLDALLKTWHEACPTEHRRMIERTMALFGIDPPAAQENAPHQPNVGQ